MKNNEKEKLDLAISKIQKMFIDMKFTNHDAAKVCLNFILNEFAIAGISKVDVKEILFNALDKYDEFLKFHSKGKI